MSDPLREQIARQICYWDTGGCDVACHAARACREVPTSSSFEVADKILPVIAEFLRERSKRKQASALDVEHTIREMFAQ